MRPAALRSRTQTRSFRSMTTGVTFQIVEPRPSADAAVMRAQNVFRDVERTCTRFDPASALMRANAGGTTWQRVPTRCFEAIAMAEQAYRATGGRFDPRVLETLEALGYSRSLPFGQQQVATARHRLPAPPKERWRPGLSAASQSVRVGRHAVDLGGVAKGLAVRWATAQLRGSGSAVLVDAGGDARCDGAGPNGVGWHIGVEDPRGDAGPIAVLRLSDLACATSSIRLRRWTSGGRSVHHLIDPATGEPGGQGLLAVTVVHDDPAWAEVWSKALFLSGAAAIGEQAEARQLAALWVDSAGALVATEPMAALMTWRSDRA